jgi:hypothetical protein
VFQSLSRDSWWSHHPHQCGRWCCDGVSIPQSGFLVVTPATVGGVEARYPSFNPSVGILGGHTWMRHRAGGLCWMFQSLSRDSWWSHPIRRCGACGHGWCFNPSVGILGGHTSEEIIKLQIHCISFNPSVGILGGHTHGGADRDPHDRDVSIPQSGFLVVTPCRAFPYPLSDRVSIPQSGFLVVTLHPLFLNGRVHRLFQSLSRDSWWSHCHALGW